MAKISGKKYTARELAEQFGVSVDTIQRHGVKLFGAGDVGKTRRYTEIEATAILKSIQTPVASGSHSVTSALSAEVETQLSLYMEASILERQAKEVWKRIAEQEKTRADTAEVVYTYNNIGGRNEWIKNRQPMWQVNINVR